MSNVQECITLYLSDPEVTDAQFRAVIADALARDLVEGKGDELDEIRAELAAHGHALVLLNRVDDVRRDQIEAGFKRDRELTGFLDTHSGALRVLRERLDALEHVVRNGVGA